DEAVDHVVEAGDVMREEARCDRRRTAHPVAPGGEPRSDRLDRGLADAAERVGGAIARLAAVRQELGETPDGGSGGGSDAAEGHERVPLDLRVPIVERPNQRRDDALDVAFGETIARDLVDGPRRIPPL